MNWREGVRRISLAIGIIGGAIGLCFWVIGYNDIRSAVEKITGGPTYQITVQKTMNEADRSRLDKIVKDMDSNHESTEAIQAKVEHTNLSTPQRRPFVSNGQESLKRAMVSMSRRRRRKCLRIRLPG
ncbi:MAG: hypothetical protein ACJ746_01510 [Bryobacteraceae bacterium]